MENLNIELTPAMLVLVPVVAALIQVLKEFLTIKQIPVDVGILIKKLLPYISVGIAFGLLYYQKVPEPLLPAIIIGLTAAGGYDLLKQKKKSQASS